MRRPSIGCALAAAFASPSFAHHSGAAYDFARLVAVEGTVTALSWKTLTSP